MENTDIENTGVDKKAEKNKKEDTHSYKGWMNSDNFFKRILGVYGYCLAGYLLLISIAIAIILPIALLSGFLGGY